MDQHVGARGEMLAAALDLAARVGAVFPLIPQGKTPAVATGCKAATRDPSQITAWWERRPLCNVGLQTGTASGFFAVDLDVRHGGDVTMRALVAEHGRLPETLRARTANGWHLFFKLPACPVRQGASVLGPGVDTRSEGGYVVAAPSIHPSGARYRWLAPLTMPPAPCPLWLAKLVAPPPAPPAGELPARADQTDVIERARLYLAKCEPAISGQGGHGRCFWAALAMVRGFGLDDASALALLEEVYNPLCQPRWSRRELQHKIEAARSRSAHPIGFLLNAPRRCA